MFYYDVIFNEGGKPYLYKSHYSDIEVGDIVFVPVGNTYNDRPVKVVNVYDETEEFDESDYKVKTITRKFDPETDVNPFDEENFNYIIREYNIDEIIDLCHRYEIDDLHSLREFILKVVDIYSIRDLMEDESILNIQMELGDFFGSDSNVKRLINYLNLSEAEEFIFDVVSVVRLSTGAMYYRGDYVERNYKIAEFFYKKSAEQLNSQALCNLGYIYQYGRTGKKNLNKAFEYFNKASLLDNLNATYKLGDMYRNGYGTKKDENLAKTLYSKAHKKLTESQDDNFDNELVCDIYLRFGDIFYEGIGTNVNYKLALNAYCHALPKAILSVSYGNNYYNKILSNIEIKINQCKRFLGLY